MTKTEFYKMYIKLDKNKTDLLKQGIAFDFVTMDKEKNFWHTGIGTGNEMSVLALAVLADLYEPFKDKVTLEQFAQSVKQNLIDFVNANY